MAHTETLQASDYIVVIKEESRLIPSLKILKRYEMVCPRCYHKDGIKRRYPEIKHGQEFQCPVCKLNMRRRGNSLTIW